MSSRLGIRSRGCAGARRSTDRMAEKCSHRYKYRGTYRDDPQSVGRCNLPIYLTDRYVVSTPLFCTDCSPPGADQAFTSSARPAQEAGPEPPQQRQGGPHEAHAGMAQAHVTLRRGMRSFLRGKHSTPIRPPQPLVTLERIHVRLESRLPPVLLLLPLPRRKRWLVWCQRVVMMNDNSWHSA